MMEDHSSTMDGATSIRGEKGQPRRKGNSYSAAKLGTKRAEKQSSRKQASGMYSLLSLSRWKRK